MSGPTYDELRRAEKWARVWAGPTLANNDARHGYAQGLVSRREECRRLREALAEVVSHMQVSLLQVDSTDDEIIVGHIRDAHAIAEKALETP